MRKILLTIMILAFFACPVMAQRYRQHQVVFVDEFGKAVTNITSISIYDVGTTDATTIYSDRAGNNTMVNPITTTSDNSTFVQSLGQVRWFQTKPTYKLTVTDGIKTLTIDSRDEGDTRFPWFTNYIGTAASLTVGDNESIGIGDTGPDVVLNWVNSTSILQWLPNVDGVAFNIGSASVNKQFDFNVYIGTGTGGLSISESASTFVWTGGTASINNSGSGITNIGVGSTGAINIGDSAAGIVTIDTDFTLTINSDGNMSITTSVASADITVDAVDGSIIIDSGEATVDDGIIIRTTGANSGIRIISLADIDITTTGTSGEDITLDNVGGSIIIKSSESANDSIDIWSTIGGIDIRAAGASAGEDIDITATGSSVNITSTETVADQIKLEATGVVSGNAINLKTTDGGIILNADGGTNGKITIDAADILTFTHVDKIIFDGATTETWEIEGTPDGFESTIVFTDPTATNTFTFPAAIGGNIMLAGTNSEIYSVVVEVTATQIKDLAANPKELVATPGSGKALKLLSCLLILDNGSVNYAEASGQGNMYICYINGDGLKATGSIEGDNFIDCTADFITAVEPVALAATAVTSIENDALVLDNDGAEYTTGDGTMTVFITYAIINLGL